MDARANWPEILALRSPNTLHDYLNANADRIRYLEIATESILLDVDTPQAYQHHLSKSAN